MARMLERGRKPWLLVEGKVSERTLAPALEYFQGATKAPHAFQVVIDLPYVATDCISRRDPVVVPARTLLSGLLEDPKCVWRGRDRRSEMRQPAAESVIECFFEGLLGTVRRLPQ